MRVVISAHNVVNYPEGGGHLWVYMQYVQGLRNAGCDVWWLEEFLPTDDSERDRERVQIFSKRLARFGLDGKLLLYTKEGAHLGISDAEAKRIFRDTDMLLNFHQEIQPRVLAQFRRTALVDIDPGLLQFWISHEQLSVAPHDLYFTTGETVGRPDANFSDCGLPWIPIRPPVALDLWPYVSEPYSDAFTTVSSWWAGEWVFDGHESYDNNKRAQFLEFAALPRMASQPLELALNLGETDEEDCRVLRANGWRVRHAFEVAGTPEDYQRYVQASRGEFSCAKASCMKFQNAWISDRSLCYLASGRPVVVQHTGPSSRLPDRLGMLRFSTLEEAADCLRDADANYYRHSRAARELTEAFFDARRVAEQILNHCSEMRRTG
jgi:hypothetical protein